jgi:hypothetical protein
MLKRTLIYVFVPIIAWVPMVIWVTSGLWSPDFFGGAAPYPGDGRPISTAITITFVVLVVGVSFVSFLAEYTLSAYEKRRKQKLLRTGRSAKAKVISIRENSDGGSIKINGKPLLCLVLDVDNGRGKQYIVKLDTIIPEEDIRRYQPGALVDVKIDKDNPKNIVIVP